MTIVPPSKCTACGYLCDAATCPRDDNAKPNPGDVTVCINCGHLMAFDDNLTLRNLTEAEMIEVAGNKTVLAIQRTRALFSDLPK